MTINQLYVSAVTCSYSVLLWLGINLLGFIYIPIEFILLTSIVTSALYRICYKRVKTELDVKNKNTFTTSSL